MKNSDSEKYEILRLMAKAGSDRDNLQATLEKALRLSAEVVNLTAASVYLFDENNQVTLQVSYSAGENSRQKIIVLENDLLSDLRRNRQLVSAYLSFGGDSPYHAFTQPLRHGETIFGAVIGIQEGEKTIVSEDVFLEALSAAASLMVLVEKRAGDKALDQSVIDEERMKVLVEMAVTVNHEINNPLTAILGNVQLMLLKNQELDEELRKKLTTIEQSALKIKDVTQKLLRLSSARTITYTEGTSMIDLSGDEESGE